MTRAKWSSTSEKSNSIRAAELGIQQGTQVTQSIAALAARTRAGQDRFDLALTRDDEKVQREEAIVRRLAEGRPALLAKAFAKIVEH